MFSIIATYHFLFHLYVWWCPWTISKFLQCFLKLVFFPLSFDISSGKHLILTKFSLFLKPTCLLLGIFLKFIFDHKEKHGFIWHKTSFFVSKTSDFLFKKKRCSLKTALPEFSIFSEVNVFTACHLSKIYIETEGKVWLYLAQNVQCFI